MMSSLRMISLLKKLYWFEFYPASYLSQPELVKLQQATSATDHQQLSLHIIENYALIPIEWSKLDLPLITLLTLSPCQQNQLFKYIALDILLHQPTTIIDGQVVKNLFALFGINNHQFQSYLQTKLAQSRFKQSFPSNLFFITLTEEQIQAIVFIAKNRYLTDLPLAVQKRLSLSSLGMESKLEDNFTPNLNEIKSALKFYLHYLWPQRLALIKSCAIV